MRRTRGWLLQWFGLLLLSSPPGTVRATPPGVNWSIRLQHAIVSHPCEGVRDTLNTLIINGDVLLNFEEGLAGAGSGDATIFLAAIDGGDIRPVLNVSPSVLDDAVDDTYRYRVLWHEYVLLRKLLLGQTSAEYFSLKERGTIYTEEELRTVFVNEVDATCAECQLAISKNWPIQDSLCAAFLADGKRGVRRELASRYATMPQWERLLPLLEQLCRGVAVSASPSSFF
ncbi:MAG: hypothetical protein V1778_05315 [bacterium]